MTFLWPSMLLSLLAVPLLVFLYLRMQQRRRKLADSFNLFRSEITAQMSRPGIRRHIPPVFFLLSLVILLTALARPQAEINLPRVEGTVILVVDVSGSMAANDVEPSRMETAKTVAREFVQSQPATVQIGVVSFSSSGFTVQTPTNDETTILNAIDRLKPQTGTSLGQGILAALLAIAVDAGLHLEGQEALIPATPQAGEESAPFDESQLDNIPEGSFPSAVIVVLSDGENNAAPDPLAAAWEASQRDVRVNTIGVGTAAGANLEVDGFTIHTQLDEATLHAIAQMTGGAYFNNQVEQDPQAIYSEITPELVVKPETMEVTSFFAGAGILILLMGAAFSMIWFNRLP